MRDEIRYLTWPQSRWYFPSIVASSLFLIGLGLLWGFRVHSAGLLFRGKVWRAIFLDMDRGELIPSEFFMVMTALHQTIFFLIGGVLVLVFGLISASFERRNRKKIYDHLCAVDPAFAAEAAQQKGTEPGEGGNGEHHGAEETPR